MRGGGRGAVDFERERERHNKGWDESQQQKGSHYQGWAQSREHSRSNDVQGCDDHMGIGTPRHLAAGTMTDGFTFSERSPTIASAYERRQLIDYHSNAVTCSYLAR